MSSERHALAVDRQIDLLVAAEDAAEELPGRRAVQHDAERVFAVGRERVIHRDAAARAPRRAVDMTRLRLGARHFVGRFGRRRGTIADREVRDFRRGAQITLEERRRELLRVGDVIEACADCVWRQERVHVHVEAEDVVDGALVLDPREPLEHPVARRGMQRRRVIERRFERCRECRECRGRRTICHLRRRHHAGAQLLDHLLADFRVLFNLGGVEMFERQPARFALVVVARRARRSDERILGVDRQSPGCMTRNRRLRHGVRRRVQRRFRLRTNSDSEQRGRCHACDQFPHASPRREAINS